MKSPHPLARFFFCKAVRKQIVPESITVEPFQSFFLLNSANYSFLLPFSPNAEEVYEHCADTPSSLLRKKGVHVFPDSVGHTTLQEKYAAHLRRLRGNYQKAFESCKTAKEIFHLERRVKTDIKSRCRLIGKVSDRYKHYPLFQSLDQIRAAKTMEEYKKNGVQIGLLNNKKIYPQGPTWMPTNQDYLKLFHDFISTRFDAKPQSILDLGCGSGILSFLCAKAFKSAQIWAIDNNPHAIETCTVNAAAFEMNNISTVALDLTKPQDLEHGLQNSKTPAQYDLIVSNPPWIACKRNPQESVILDGVYDHKGLVLESSIKIAARRLKGKQSRMLLIYSDLCAILGLQGKSVEQLAQENSLILHSQTSIPYSKALAQESPLNAFKQRAHIVLYEIGKA